MASAGSEHCVWQISKLQQNEKGRLVMPSLNRTHRNRNKTGDDNIVAFRAFLTQPVNEFKIRSISGPGRVAFVFMGDVDLACLTQSSENPLHVLLEEDLLESQI